MAITDGYFPQEGLFKGTDDLVNIADHLEPTPLGNETLTVSNTVETLTPEDDSVGANIYVEVAPIRFWVDATDPTNSQGIYVMPGGCIELTSPYELEGFKAIATTDTDAILQVSYWR